MAKESDKIGFTTHSLERALERLFKYEAPYSEEDLLKVKDFIIKTMTWHSIRECWVLDDFKAELVVKGDSVVTLVIRGHEDVYDKPVTERQKKYSKKLKRQSSYRNAKSKVAENWKYYVKGKEND